MSSKMKADSKADKGRCPFGRVWYPTKRDAEAATGGRAKRCGRCRGWHA